jgi:DNA-binding CsgD family transcriptional regulator
VFYGSCSAPIHPLRPRKCLQMTKEKLEGFLAEGLSLEQIGKRVGRTPSTISYHLKKHGLVPANQGQHASRGGLPELKLRELAASGISVRQMARELGRSPSTVRYWLDRFGIKVHGIRGNRAKALAARTRGEKSIVLRCRHHGETDFYVAPDGTYHCKVCRTERVAQWRRNAKERLINAAGGRCVLCGYNRCSGSLHFHHLDPTTKSFGLAMRGHTKSFAKLLTEARKCVLLCANCHAEVERGVTELPQELLRDARRDDGNLS